MTLQDLLEHHERQLKCFQAYSKTDGDDAKAAKSYRKHIAESQERVDVLREAINKLESIK